MVSFGYLPPLFGYQDGEVAVPSVWAKMVHCRNVWR